MSKRKYHSQYSWQYWIRKGLTKEESQLKVQQLQYANITSRIKRIKEKIKLEYPLYTKIGWWTVVGNDSRNGKDLGKNRSGNFIQVECKCGLKTWVLVSALRAGKSKGCRGCYHRGKINNRWNGYKEMSGTVYHKIRASAKERNIDFTITKKQIYDLMYTQKFRCALTDETLVWDTASLDRIDSNKGYLKGNIQWVLPEINYMKHTLTLSDFIELCRKVSVKMVYPSFR